MLEILSLRNILRPLAVVFCPVLFALLCFPRSVQALEGGGTEEGITLVYASHLADVHKDAAEGGLTELAGLLRKLRQEKKHVVFFHGGNALGPSALSSLDKGSHMVGLLNMLEPAAMAAGQRDFMYREDELAMRAREAIFPILCSNVADPLTGKEPHGLERDCILEVARRRLGVFALVSPGVTLSYLQERLSVSGGFSLSVKESRRLQREKGAEFIIGMADSMPADPRKVLEQSGADVLFIAGAPETRVERVHEMAYVLHGNEGDAVVMELEQRPEALARGKSPLAVGSVSVVSLREYPPDEYMATAVQKHRSTLDSLMGISVGETRTPLDTRTCVIRTGENAFANLVADALREYYNADVALIHAGAIRGNQRYPAGSALSKRDIQSELPLHDTSCLVSMTGGELRRALEHGLAGVEQANGRFLHVSGMNFVFTPSEPVGTRVRSMFVQGKELDSDTEYLVSVPTFLVEGGEGFSMFGQSRVDAPRPRQEVREIVRAFVSRHSPVSPLVEGRIQVVE